MIEIGKEFRLSKVDAQNIVLERFGTKDNKKEGTKSSKWRVVGFFDNVKFSLNQILAIIKEYEIEVDYEKSIYTYIQHCEDAEDMFTDLFSDKDLLKEDDAITIAKSFKIFRTGPRNINVEYYCYKQDDFQNESPQVVSLNYSTLSNVFSKCVIPNILSNTIRSNAINNKILPFYDIISLENFTDECGKVYQDLYEVMKERDFSKLQNLKKIIKAEDLEESEE